MNKQGRVGNTFQSVNLLFDTFETPSKRDTKTVSLTFFSIAAIVFLTSIGMYILMLGLLKRYENQNKALKQQIVAATPKIELIYNLNLRNSYRDQTQVSRFSPAKIIRVLNGIVSPEGNITAYQINSQGEINIRIRTSDISQAAKLWFYLVSNKQLVTELNLHSFSFDSENNTVNFALRGKLDLKKLEQSYALPTE